MIYFFCRENLPESTYKYQLLGLNLLCLLAQNRVAEFHTVSKETILKDSKWMDNINYWIKQILKVLNNIYKLKN